MVTNRRIPTVLALGLVGVLVLGVALSVAGLGQVTKFFNFASSGSVLSQATVANVTDTSFTVAWVTDKEESGSVAYGKTAGLGDGVAVDERNLTSPSGKYRTHFVRVSGLAAETKYYYKIQPGGASEQVTTAAKQNAASVVDPIYGKVTDGSGSIVTWEGGGEGKLATLVKGDGSYVIPVPDLSTGTIETILINSGAGVATISCVAGKDRPLPTVKIGDGVDCQQKTAVASPSGAFKVPKGAQVNLSNGETVSTPLPTITGKARPGQVVKITIHSDTPYSGTVMADPAGNWSWTPPANLSPGEHTVTITVVGADGTTQTVTRTFTVASGSPILPVTSGTPSATLTHKACVNNSCMVVDGLGSDTCTGDSDCAATPSAQPIPPPVQTTPPTGAVENTFLLLGAGMLFLIVGTRLWRII